MKTALFLLQFVLFAGGSVLRFRRQLTDEEIVEALRHVKFGDPSDVPTEYVFDVDGSRSDEESEEAVTVTPAKDEIVRDDVLAPVEKDESADKSKSESDENMTLRREDSSCNSTSEEDDDDEAVVDDDEKMDAVIVFGRRDLNSTKVNEESEESMSEDDTVKESSANETIVIVTDSKKLVKVFAVQATNTTEEVEATAEDSGKEKMEADEPIQQSGKDDKFTKNFSESKDEQFDRIDADDDDKVSFGEFLAKDEEYVRSVLNEFSEADKNGDASLSKAEFLAFIMKDDDVIAGSQNTSASLLEEFDDNGDGKLDKDELALMLTAFPFYEALRVASGIIEKFDANGNGLIDKNEFAALRDNESER